MYTGLIFQILLATLGAVSAEENSQANANNAPAAVDAKATAAANNAPAAVDANAVAAAANNAPAVDANAAAAPTPAIEKTDGLKPDKKFCFGEGCCLSFPCTCHKPGCVPRHPPYTHKPQCHAKTWTSYETRCRTVARYPVETNWAYFTKVYSNPVFKTQTVYEYPQEVIAHPHTSEWAYYPEATVAPCGKCRGPCCCRP